MFLRISRFFINNLLARTDIIQLINLRVKLKKKGKNFQACCPFHDDKVPSFTVNSEKQFFYCFGYGIHGHAIDFLMKYDGLEFIESVEELAIQNGLEVLYETRPGYTAKKRVQIQNLYQVMQDISNFYQQALTSPIAIQAERYLQRRGLSKKVILQFSIGFSPPGWNDIIKRFGLSSKNLSLLKEAGMLVIHDNGKIYDRFLK